jgi:hypothetical protein
VWYLCVCMHLVVCVFWMCVFACMCIVYMCVIYRCVYIYMCVCVCVCVCVLCICVITPSCLDTKSQLSEVYTETKRIPILWSWY